MKTKVTSKKGGIMGILTVLGYLLFVLVLGTIPVAIVIVNERRKNKKGEYHHAWH